MANNVDILVLDDPTIELEELSIVDAESNTENQDSNTDNGNHVASVESNISPIIKINDFLINSINLDGFEIDCTGFVPTCTVSFYDASNMFTELYYPKEGDVMKIYISPGGKEETWKPIRIDFQILNISEWNDEGTIGYTIEGEMKIPSFELQKCEVFKDKTSFEVCREIAKNLKLGFSSNIQSTDDAQVWINNYGTDARFLQRIVSHSYYDENSFMTAYIDPYYYFTFVECNSIINDADNDGTTIDALPTAVYLASEIHTNSNYNDVEDRTAPDFLTNSNEYVTSNIGISDYGVINNSGSIVQQYGYKTYVKYWDDREEEYIVEFITPFISEGANIQHMTVNEKDENAVKNNVKKLSMRAQTENMHKNYNYAEVCNRLNLIEIDKYGINLMIPGFNPSLTRFQKKYIAIYTQGDMAKSEMMLTEEAEKGSTDISLKDEVLNTTLSGFYTITGITYQLVESTLCTIVNLRKRAIKTLE